ncbi:MAG TPA: phosphatidate cytidylyltransferase [Steroidobacteraceae bacterium]|jgi:phosphatidate cytidylyltransferase|nr:phosphatidate cytidylyltransferase [Steroidobacteraceae bacterium]
MRSRLLTAFGLGVLLIAAVLYASTAVTTAILGLILLIGGWEWSAFLAVAIPWRLAYVLVLGALGVLGLRYTLDGTLAVTHLLLSMRLAVAWWLAALVWIIWAPTRVGRAAAALAGVLALVPTWVALVRIDARWVHGAQWTLFILALAFAADTGAFFTGRRFGRTRLAPRVSPNKTWEGVLGGMLLALLIAWVGTVWFEQPAAGFVPLCLAAAAFSVVGDLTESLLKRHVHLKDSGRLFPGHGGVLDRIDSVTAATPVMALGLMWLGAGR